MLLYFFALVITNHQDCPIIFTRHRWWSSWPKRKRWNIWRSSFKEKARWVRSAGTFYKSIGLKSPEGQKLAMRFKFYFCHLKVDLAEWVFAFPAVRKVFILHVVTVQQSWRHLSRFDCQVHWKERKTRQSFGNTEHYTEHYKYITSFIQSILSQSPIHTPMSATVHYCLFSRKWILNV